MNWDLSTDEDPNEAYAKTGMGDTEHAQRLRSAAAQRLRANQYGPGYSTAGLQQAQAATNSLAPGLGNPVADQRALGLMAAQGRLGDVRLGEEGREQDTELGREGDEWRLRQQNLALAMRQRELERLRQEKLERQKLGQQAVKMGAQAIASLL